jgi:hypothetical protein
MGPAPSTVSSSSETMVGSAVPQRASAAAYSRPVRVGCQRKRKRRGVEWWDDAHISARAPEDVFTVRPNVDRARKEPSKMKWMSASNVCGWSQRQAEEKERKEGRKSSYEPDEGGAVLPRCVLGEEGSRRGRRDERDTSDAGEGVRGRCSENRWCLG